MRKASGHMESVYQTEAQWTADGRVFPPDVVAITTDGANIGKHKLMDGVHRWSALSYVEASTGGGASVYLDGVAQDGTYTVTVSTVSGQAIVDWTAATPALASCELVSVVVPDSPITSFRVDSPTVGNMVIQLYDLQTGQDITTSGDSVTITVVGIEA